MKIQDYKEIIKSETLPIDKFLTLIKEVKDEFEKNGCENIRISIDGDNYGDAYLNIYGDRQATEQEIKEQEIRDKEKRKKVKITYELRTIG